MRHAKTPCRDCPFRRDAPAGHFTPARYEALRCTVGDPGQEAPIDAPLFACHASREGREVACAGWLAVTGHQHLGVRLAVITGALPAEALTPRPDWPALYDSYDQLPDVP